MAKQFSYHFSIGNSTRGKVGMCFRVKAITKAEAVTKANEYLSQFEQGFALDKADDIEYCEVYTRAAVTAKDIDDYELADPTDDNIPDAEEA